MENPMDYFNATAEDLKADGWADWEEGNPLLLCPRSVFAELPDGIRLVSIAGDAKVKGRDHIDQDHRYGFLAWGIVPGETSAALAPSAVEVQAAEAKRRADLVEMLLQTAEASQHAEPAFVGDLRAAGLRIATPDDIRDLLGARGDA